MKKLLLGLLILALAVTPAFAGASRDFNGTTSYIDTASTLSQSGGPITCAAWILPDDAGEGGAGYVWSKFVSATNAWVFGFFNTGDRIGFTLVRTTTNMVRNTDDFAFGSWQFIVWTWDGTLTDVTTAAKFYRGTLTSNGVAETGYVTSTTGSGTHDDSAGLFQIGNRTSDTARTFNGQIAHVHVYSKVLSVREMNEIMYKPGSVRDSLKLYLPMFGVDSPESDLSGNNFDGTVSNAATSALGPPVFYSGDSQ